MGEPLGLGSETVQDKRKPSVSCITWSMCFHPNSFLGDVDSLQPAQEIICIHSIIIAFIYRCFV